MLGDGEIHWIELASINGDLVLSVFLDSFMLSQTGSANWRMTKDNGRNVVIRQTVIGFAVEQAMRQTTTWK